jgi:type III restriction enzyme
LPNLFKTENGKTFLDTENVGEFQKEISGDFWLKIKWVIEEVIEINGDFEIVKQNPTLPACKYSGNAHA